MCASAMQWGVATAVADMRAPFSGEEMAEGVDVLFGGGKRGANAYGIGQTTMLYGGGKLPKVRTVGWGILTPAREKLRRVEEEADAEVLIRMQELGVGDGESGWEAEDDDGYGWDDDELPERGQEYEDDDGSEDLGSGANDFTSSSE
jgi:hypothetical protein